MSSILLCLLALSASNVNGLGDDSWAVREASQHRLAALRPVSLPAVVLATYSRDPEVVKRAEELLSPWAGWAEYARLYAMYTLTIPKINYYDQEKVQKLVDWLDADELRFRVFRQWAMDADLIGREASFDLGDTAWTWVWPSLWSLFQKGQSR